MSTWSRGRALLRESLRRDGIELQPFIDGLGSEGLHRVSRSAVFLMAEPATVPNALLHNFKHNQVVHEHNVLVTVVFHEVPWVGQDRRAEVQSLGQGFWRVELHFGFMDIPDVPKALQGCQVPGLSLAPMETSYFLSRATVVTGQGTGLASWRQKLFAMMSSNSGSAAEFFRLPDNAVVELGTRVQL